MIELRIPLTEKDIERLNYGDEVLLNGTIFTARDKAHLFLLQNNFEKMHNSVIYHCGPIIKEGKVVSAGPTTSARLNAYTPELIKKYDIKAVIGKGGMDKTVLNALKDKAVYFAAIGGLGVIYAKSIAVKNVYQEEFGMAEAIWEFEIKDFPVIVAMDSKGNSLYEEVLEKSENRYKELIKQ